MYLAYERWVCGLYKAVVKMPNIDYKIFCFLASEITKWLKNEFIPSTMLREILKDFVYDDRAWQLVMRDVSWVRFDSDFNMYSECFDYGSIWFSFKFCDDLHNALKDIAGQIYYSKDGEARSRIMWELGDSQRDNWGVFERARAGKIYAEHKRDNDSALSLKKAFILAKNANLSLLEVGEILKKAGFGKDKVVGLIEEYQSY